MTKVTIGVYQAYKNSGNLRYHKKGTKKSWKHYCIEIDDYDEDEYSFGSEWVSSLRAIFLKRKQVYKKAFQCPECERAWTAFVPKKCNQMECPWCED